MESLYVSDQTFKNESFVFPYLKPGEYENCRFVQCNFTGSDISKIAFIDCVFESCNLSNVKLNKTNFRDASFKDCKMLGLHFETCNQLVLSVALDSCELDHSSFYKTKMKKTNFLNCRMHEVDFTECDLSGAVFNNCDLQNAVFASSNLEKTDFSTSYNYTLDPDNNRLKKTKFSAQGALGLLSKHDIIIE